jgi:hypothetical protein
MQEAQLSPILGRAMWRDELTQGFLTSSRRRVTPWHYAHKLGTSGFIGIVMLVTISSVRKAPSVAAGCGQNQLEMSRKFLCVPASPRPRVSLNKLLMTPAVAASLTDWQVSSVNSVLKSLANKGITSRYSPQTEPSYIVVDLPSTLPPTYFPASSDGVVNVPPVKRPERSIPTLPSSTIPPVTLPPTVFPTNQPPAVRVPSLQRTPEPSVESVPPDWSSSPVIEFGQSLPKTTRKDSIKS